MTTRKRAPGGGRKPLAQNDQTVSREITMPESYWTCAAEMGDGNASAGVRSALARCCDAHAALAMAEYDRQDTTQLHAAVIAAERALRTGKE